MLDSLFAAARAAEPEPRPEFLLSLAEQAAEVTAARAAGRIAPERGRSDGTWSRLRRAADRFAPLLWPTGMAVPVLCGLWLGAWADAQGYFDGSALAASDLAMGLAYRLPEVSTLVGGY